MTNVFTYSPLTALSRLFYNLSTVSWALFRDACSIFRSRLISFSIVESHTQIDLEIRSSETTVLETTVSVMRRYINNRIKQYFGK
mgnify:CR=1 FL=1